MAPKRQPRIKNYTTVLSVDESLSLIHRALTSHKARRVTFESDEDGNPVGIEFALRISGDLYGYRLPARFDGVRRLVDAAFREMGKPLSGTRLEEQTRRVAWANLKDWILAQMALVDAEVERMEVIFFPYLLAEGNRTTFEVFEEQLALPEPREVRRVITPE